MKEASTLRTEFARTAIAWLLEQEDAMANKVLRSVCVRTDFPVGLAREFRDQLVARGLGDPLKLDAAKLAESVAFLPNMIGNARAGEIAFLESVLAACGPGPSSSPRAPELEPDRSPLTLRRLATSIGLNQHAAASDLDAIRIDEGKPILEVVIRGAVVAMGLDRSSLRSEAELALAGVSEDRERRSSLWWMGYGESEELDWDRASAELRPSSELLARGLHHPSRVIAVCALHLLAAGSKDEGIRAVRAQLGAYRSFGLLLATHACLHWGEPAIVAIIFFVADSCFALICKASSLSFSMIRSTDKSCSTSKSCPKQKSAHYKAEWDFKVPDIRSLGIKTGLLPKRVSQKHIF